MVEVKCCWNMDFQRSQKLSSLLAISGSMLWSGNLLEVSGCPPGD